MIFISRACPALFILCAAASLTCAQEPTPLASWRLPDPAPRADSRLPDPESWQPFEQGSLSGLPVPRTEPELDGDHDSRCIFVRERRTCGEWFADARAECLEGLDKVRKDFIHNYTGRHLAGLGIALAIAAPLANTDADRNFQNWYQRDARSPLSDRWAKGGNKLGEHWVTVPVFLGAAAAGKIFEDYHAGQWVGDWGKRSIRALICGSPSVCILQAGLGASRPGEDHGSSHWRPFRDNNSVAGHGFVGAVPFLTAASMTENRPLRALLFAGSFWTCYARINTDSHYLSQSILGWSIAFLAVQSVNQTEAEYRRWHLVPLELPQGGTGVGVMIRF